MKKKNIQGFGEWHENKKQETINRLLSYLKKIDNVEIDDPQRGLRSLHRATRIELTTLSKTLKRLAESGKILEIRGKNRSRLFCLKSDKNEDKKKDYENNYDIESKNRKKRRVYHNKDKIKLKTIITMLESIFSAYQIKSYIEKENHHNSDPIEINLNEYIIDASKSALLIMRKLLDNRVALLPQMRSMMLAISSQTSTRNAAMKHFGEIRKRFVVDPVRIAELTQVTSYEEFIEFIQRDPWNWGYLDMLCPKCDKFAMKTSMNLNGTWDLVCKNFLAHKDKLPHFPASLFSKWCEDLKVNKKGLAEKYLKRFGIEV